MPGGPRERKEKAKEKGSQREKEGTTKGKEKAVLEKKALRGPRSCGGVYATGTVFNAFASSVVLTCGFLSDTSGRNQLGPVNLVGIRLG